MVIFQTKKLLWWIRCTSSWNLKWNDNSILNCIPTHLGKYHMINTQHSHTLFCDDYDLPYLFLTFFNFPLKSISPNTLLALSLFSFRVQGLWRVQLRSSWTVYKKKGLLGQFLCPKQVYFNSSKKKNKFISYVEPGLIFEESDTVLDS